MISLKIHTNATFFTLWLCNKNACFTMTKTVAGLTYFAPSPSSSTFHSINLLPILIDIDTSRRFSQDRSMSPLSLGMCLSKIIDITIRSVSIPCLFPASPFSGPCYKISSGSFLTVFIRINQF